MGPTGPSARASHVAAAAAAIAAAAVVAAVAHSSSTAAAATTTAVAADATAFVFVAQSAGYTRPIGPPNVTPVLIHLFHCTAIIFAAVAAATVTVAASAIAATPSVKPRGGGFVVDLPYQMHH